MYRSSLDVLDTAKPADFSFKKLKELSALDTDQARATRIGRLPDKGKQNKFLTRAIWLNNNRLANLEKLDLFLDSVMEFPEQLGWIDLSFNSIAKIDEVLLRFENLKIVYLHRNKIDDFQEVKKLRALRNLRTLTLHGNPISDRDDYRWLVIAAAPQVVNLDFTPVTNYEKS